LVSPLHAITHSSRLTTRTVFLKGLSTPILLHHHNISRQ
jgi:hypothetical protein